MRTFADWSEPSPGFLEVDFVSRGGDSMQGTFLWSLLATDVCSGWTEAVARGAREKSLVVEGMEVTRRHLPVPVLGIDSDNDSAFINETLQGYCQDSQVLVNLAEREGGPLKRVTSAVRPRPGGRPRGR